MSKTEKFETPVNAVLREQSELGAKAEILQKDMAEKNGRAEAAKEKLAANLTISAELHTIRQGALADGDAQKLAQVEAKLAALEKENVFLKSTIDACEKVISEKREQHSYTLQYKAGLDTTLAEKRLIELLPEYNAKTTEYAELLAKVFHLGAVAGWTGFRESLPENLYLFTVNEPVLKVWSLTHGLIKNGQLVDSEV